MADLGAIGVDAGSEKDSGKATTGFNFFSIDSFSKAATTWTETRIDMNHPELYSVQKIVASDTVVDYSASVQIKTVSGTVKENGSLVAGRMVRVFSRADGRLLGQSQSGENGGFVVSIIGFTGEVTTVAYDDDAGINYNAVVLDRIIVN